MTDLDAATLLFRDLKRGPRLLTPAEERNLLRRYHRGDAAAKTHLIEANLRLVVSVAKGYVGRGLELGELVSSGTEGLIRAIELFDLERETKLSTLAVWHIKATCRRAIANTARTIRLPAHVEQHRYDLDVTEARLLASRTEVTDIELAAAAGLDLETFDRIRRATRVTSLNAPVGNGEDDGSELQDLRPDETGMFAEPFAEAAKHGMSAAMQAALDGLSYRHRRVLQMRYGLDGDGRVWTLDEVAVAFGGGDGQSLQRERVRQIALQAEEALRASQHADALLAELGEAA